ncbi:MAG: hypothetical protein JNL19_14895 [Burkholderiales bacterium]|nr:hypothetical protein [Burkholderiales bacterium]
MTPSFRLHDRFTPGFNGVKTSLWCAMPISLGGVLVAALLVAGCAQVPTAPTPPPEAKPVIAPEPLPTVAPPTPVVVAPTTPVAPSPAKPAAPTAAEIATAPSTTPPGTKRYQCVRSGGGDSRPIEFPESSGRICARFPAMGPCQYERDACRRDGGRVIRFDGIEITPEVEREYDKQVQRFRLNAG